MPPPILLPWSLSLSRLALAPALAWAILEHRPGLALGLLVVGMLSDLLDGVLARRLHVATPAGAYLDAGSDFVLLLAGFVAFAQDGLYRSLPVVMVLMFAQFVLTSRSNRLVYDPVGKYYGALLYAVALLTLVAPDEALAASLEFGVLGLSLVSLASRLEHLRPARPRRVARPRGG